MRQLVLVTVVSLILLGTGSPVPAQNCAQGVIACTAQLDPGRPGVYDDSITDLTYHAARKEVWAIEGPIPGFQPIPQSRVTVYREDLAGGRRSFNVGFVEPAFGIAEIPEPLLNAGNVYVLTPDSSGAAGIEPAIGIMDRDGNLVEPDGLFRPITDPLTGGPPSGYFSSIDAHPTEPEIVLLDDGSNGGGAHIVFVDLQYQVSRPPILIEGGETFYGGGIAYVDNDTVLVTAQFGNSFESRLAMVYSREGRYLEKTVVLDAAGNGLSMLALGIDIGLVGQSRALFLYDVQTDTIYSLPLDADKFLTVPGPVQGLDPACAVQPDGRVQLTWNNDLNYTYDGIAVFENGVLVAALDGESNQFTSSAPVQGKYEYCLETRKENEPGQYRVCCEGQSGGQFPFLPPDAPVGARLAVGPPGGAPHFLLGLATPAIVEQKDSFRLYTVGSYDNQVQVLDHERQVLPAETIVTDPPRQTLVVNNSIRNYATGGIALIDLPVQGQPVHMYALLDFDGPNGDFVPGASIHFLENTTLPGNPAPTPAGSLFQDEIPAIDFAGVSPGNMLLIDWDADPAGDLITLDLASLRILKIRYNQAEGTMRAVEEAPLPFLDLTPFHATNFPLGQISVLPSGNYLVSAGDPFDPTVNRTFLLTPLGPDPQTSARLVGQMDGLLSFSQFFTLNSFGHSMGPDVSYGLDTTFFKNEGPDGAGSTFYNIQHFDFPTPRPWIFIGNLIVGLTNSVSHPNLVAEPLLNEESTLGTLAPLDTGPLSPSFGPRTTPINYHYHLINPSELSSLRVRLRVLLNNAEVPELREDDVLIPPGRSLYRTATERSEKTLALRVENLGPGPGPIRILAGATGLSSAVPVEQFRRGDADDSAALDLSDAITILNYSFLGGATPLCLDAADVNDTGDIDLTDPIHVLNWLFLGGAPISPPGPVTCGPDVEADTLAACVYESC